MSDAPGHQERMLNLVALLLKSRVPIELADLLEQVEGYADDSATHEAAERKFHSDKRRLGHLGVKIEWTEERYGQSGYMLDTTASLLPPIGLTAEERLLLETLARSVLEQAEGEFKRTLNSALFKLQFDNFDESASSRATANEGDRGGRDGDLLPADEDPDSDLMAGRLPAMLGAVTTEKQREQANLDLFMDAVFARKTVRFRYSRPGRESMMRTVDPWGIAFIRGAWYLAGYSHEREAERVFKLVRMEGKAKRASESAGPDFDPPTDWSLPEMVNRLVTPRDAEGKIPEVRLAVAPDVAFMLRAWAETEPSVSFEAAESPDGDDGGTAVLASPMSWTVWRIVSDHAPLVHVTAPDELRQTHIARLRRLRDRYATNEPAD